MTMATTHGLSPQLLRNLGSFVRRLNSTSASASASTSSSSAAVSAAAVPPLTFTETPTTTTTTTSDSILDFNDTKGLFSSVSTGKLIKTSATLHAAAIEPVVHMGVWLMNSRIMEMGLLREVLLGTIKHTVYEHFVAGSNTEEVGRTITKLSGSGLRGMLDYGLEHATDSESCDRNAAEFIQTVESTKSLPPSSVSFVVTKITAICPVSLLRRVSDLLRWEYKEKSFHLPWKLNTLPIFSNSSPFYHTITKPNSLTREEERDLQLAHERLMNICEKCVEANVPLAIDAEDTSIQPGIDYFTYSAAIMYNNKGEKPIIFGTIQTYLKDAKDRLMLAKKAADKMELPVGFKLVRGAYMLSETEFASSLGVESPIHNNIQATHNCYNDCASLMLEEVANGPGSVVLATHNVESGELAARKARELGIRKETERLQFAQLYGMADSLSFGLRNAGFDVSKYLPFGPVDQIIPYLLRRAEENKGLLSSSAIDRQLIKKELTRRLKASVVPGSTEVD